jgi:hypothetical protein
MIRRKSGRGEIPRCATDSISRNKGERLEIEAGGTVTCSRLHYCRGWSDEWNNGNFRKFLDNLDNLSRTFSLGFLFFLFLLFN